MGIKFFIIIPYVEPASLWYRKNIPAPRFFLDHSKIPIVVNDSFDPDFFYCGYCRNCNRELDEKKLFCSKYKENFPPTLIRKTKSKLRYLMKDYHFNFNPEKNHFSQPLGIMYQALKNIIKKRQLKKKISKKKKNICRLCGNDAKLDKHHITYTPEKILKVCKSCH